MVRTLVVTNDYPPRPGGIQEFVQAMVDGFTPSDVVVYTSTWRGRAQECERYDHDHPYTTVRDRSSIMVPEPRVVRRAAEIARTEGCERVWFGAAAPLGLMGGALRKAGVSRLVATSHGHEAGWAQLPGARGLLRRIGESVDVVTYLSEYQRQKIGRVLTPAAAARMAQLAPGVDVTRFRPELRDSEQVKELKVKYGVADRPLVVCVSRLVPRKGQDILIRAWPQVQRSIPDAALLIVSGGPDKDRLRKLIETTGVGRSVTLTGSVPWADLPLYFAAGDVFAMPCRTRRGGLDVEGLGIVYLEASATGIPVVGGDSGGAPDAVAQGRTGYVVSGRSIDDRVAMTAERITALLADPAAAAAMGAAGRAWVEERWQWPAIQDRFRALLAGTPVARPAP
jgi:phosphatidylinositol alpha-1,6-mannosyltransferase